MLDTYTLTKKGFSYAGYYSLDHEKLKRYDSVLPVHRLRSRLAGKQYCYTDSEQCCQAILRRIRSYDTVRVQQLSWNSWIMAWSKAKPKQRQEQVLYTDLEGNEYNWSLTCE